MIRPGPLLYVLRREMRRGLAASWHYHRTLPRIAAWRAPQAVGKIGDAPPIHMLTGADDWLLAAWALASWFTNSAAACKVVLHDDGTMPSCAREVFTRMLPDIAFVSRGEADEAMADALRPYPHCAQYRALHPLALKIFDAPHFCASDRFMLLDSDVLFFQRPTEIGEWAASSNDECWFNEDVAEGSLLSGEEAAAKLGVTLWPRINSGLCLLHKHALDLALCERALAGTRLMQGHIWRVEQTLFALCASHHGRGGLLPRTYEVSLARHAAPGAVARHYVGAVRNRFYSEGVARLAPSVLGTCR